MQHEKKIDSRRQEASHPGLPCNVKERKRKIVTAVF